MKVQHLAALGVCAAIWGTPALADSYQFDVLYSGQGQASLAGGSDNPTNTTLWDGDSFVWTISSVGGVDWTVQTGGSFFALMAFATQEPGERVGDFTLTLSNNGGTVFSYFEAGANNQQVHVGTNSVVLPTGLTFDHMRLDYLLVSATELQPDDQLPTALALPVGTTPTGLLPVFGAPEMNPYAPGIIYGPVPEPGTWALWLGGLLAVGGRVAAKRRRA